MAGVTGEGMKPVERPGRVTTVLVLAALVSSFGSSFQYGYNLAALSGPTPYIRRFIFWKYFEHYDKYIDTDIYNIVWCITVASFPLGGFFGSLMVAPLVNKLGRKGTLLFNNIFSIVPAVMMGVSEVAKCFEMIILARFIVGICAGISSNVVPMYLGELAPKNLRGAICTVPQLFISIGILVAQVLGINSILATLTGWPILLGLTGVPALIQLLILPFFPESPRYTLIQKDDETKAKKALRCLRGWDDVDAEIAEMRLEDQSEKAEGRMSVCSLLSQRSFRWQLVSIIVLNLGQQLSGVNAIYYYPISIYGGAGISGLQHMQYAAVASGGVNFVMNIVAIFIVKASGRRLLLLCGFGICCLACVALTVVLNFQDRLAWLPYISIACIIVYVIGHTIGPSPIPSLMTMEMFSQSSRPAAFMVAGSVHWLSNFAVAMTFPYVQSGLGRNCFILFAAVCLVTLVYIWLLVPETKNKTFLEVCQMFAKRNKVEVHMADGGLPMEGSREGWRGDETKFTSF